MTFKSSLPALGYSLALLAVLAPELRAQAPAPPAVRKAPGAYLRIWNTIIPSETMFDLTMGSDPNAKPLQTAAPGNFQAAYERVLPGRYTLRVAKPGAHDTPLKSFDVALADRSYSTVMVSQDGAGQVAVELINDTPDPKAPGNKLVVRQFCKDARAVVTAGSSKDSTAALDYGQTQVLDNLPKGRVPVQVRATTPKGVRTFGVEVDFTQSHRATVFIFNDVYGRLRMRFSVDGPDPETEAENAAAAAPRP